MASVVSKHSTEVVAMLASAKSYREVSEHLKTKGVQISRQSIHSWYRCYKGKVSRRAGPATGAVSNRSACVEHVESAAHATAAKDVLAGIVIEGERKLQADQSGAAKFLVQPRGTLEADPNAPSDAARGLFTRRKS